MSEKSVSEKSAKDALAFIQRATRQFCEEPQVAQVASAKLLIDVPSSSPRCRTRLVAMARERWPTTLVLEIADVDALGVLSWRQTESWLLQSDAGVPAVLRELCKRAGLL